MSSELPSGTSSQPSPPDSPLLDSHGDNPTRWERRVSEPNAGAGPADPDTDPASSGGLSNEGSDSDGSGQFSDPDTLSRQQKRVFHRVNTLLHYWEARDYALLWITLTSAPDSDGADRLAYNLQRLRQTVERAKIATDGDGEHHRLSHITELEQLCIRTSEGPPGKGVLHLFWAWKPPKGHHSRELFIPQHWLANQWGRIHGNHELVSNPGGDVRGHGDIDPLYVWIERYGTEDYHDRNAVARYCVTQYLGDHGEALEHLSWSHGRTLGGSLMEAWEAVKEHREALSEAIETWEEVIGGQAVTLGSKSQHVHYGLQVRPPPNLGVEIIEDVSVEPPEDYTASGPDTATVRRSRRFPEYDPAEFDRGLCPECREYYVVEAVERRDGQISYACSAERCGAEFVEAGDSRFVVVEQELETWDVEPSPPSSDGATYEYDPDEQRGPETLTDMSRAGSVYRPRLTEWEKVERYVEQHPDATVPQILGALEIDPEQRSKVREVVADD